MTLEEAIAKIRPLDHNAMEIAQKRWDSIAKPLHSLGKLETLLIQIAGITGNAEVDLSRRGLIAMCGQRCGRRRRDTDRTGSYCHRCREFSEI